MSGKIDLENGNYIEYDIIWSPEGIGNILWGEYRKNGEKTRRIGDILLDASTNGKKYEDLIVEDYSKC